MNKFTTGPWSDPSTYGANRFEVQAEEKDGTGFRVAIIDKLADARLIAAAPDLFAALQTTAGNIRSLGPAGAIGPYSKWLEVVEAALAKAQ